MIRWIRHFAALFAAMASIAAASPAAAQREITDAPAVWTHRGVGVAFPATIGDFQRDMIYEYNAEGTDVSVGYNLMRGGKRLALVTIYIYPPFPIGGCENQYADVKKSIEQADAYTGVRLVSETRAPSPSGRNAGVAYLARYKFNMKFDGAQEALPVQSDAYLFCPAGAKWLVAYRATMADGADIGADVDMLTRSFQWPAFLDR
jgi:hypothetical protein